MKKIMFLLLMVVSLMTSLYALDTDQVVCAVEKSQGVAVDNIATPADVTLSKVSVLHKDTLSYSSIKSVRIDVSKERPPTLSPNINGGYGNGVLSKETV